MRLPHKFLRWYNWGEWDMNIQHVAQHGSGRESKSSKMGKWQIQDLPA
jgi:hypothetical protein